MAVDTRNAITPWHVAGNRNAIDVPDPADNMNKASWHLEQLEHRRDHVFPGPEMCLLCIVGHTCMLKSTCCLPTAVRSPPSEQHHQVETSVRAVLGEPSAVSRRSPRRSC